MSFLCDEKVAKYVTKMSKYVIFSGLKSLKKGNFRSFLLPIFFNPSEYETFFNLKMTN